LERLKELQRAFHTFLDTVNIFILSEERDQWCGKRGESFSKMHVLCSTGAHSCHVYVFI
jgi:hypothetical protein